MMTPPIASTLHVGLDVAKLTLQVDLAGKALAIANTPAGHRTLRTHLRRLPLQTTRPTHVVCEGTGGYERAFARAQGRLAKTDALDAAVLSAFGAAM